MTVFVLKLIALASMLIDHLGAFLFPRAISISVYTLMRTVGRAAFPIFCFLIVNGYQKTHDVKGYLTRLVSFAVISQVPFVLAFDAAPFPQGSGLHAQLAYRWFLCLIFILVAAVVWWVTVRPGQSVIWPVLALTLAVLRVEYNGVRILSDELNVFYTHALGLSLICVLDAVRKPDRDPVRLLLQALALFAALFLIRENADYRALGLALIVSLWLTREYRVSQALVILLWCVAEYLLSGRGWVYFTGAAASLVPVMLYNGRLGRPLKRAFYLFYPAHIAVIGVLTVYDSLV